MTVTDYILPLSWAVPLLLAATAAITWAGVRATNLADRLADRTGVGEALIGAVVVGAITSLGGSVMSVVTAHDGYPALAISNALGGIAVQTFFLAIADIAYRRANLEHAAASPENLIQGGLLLVMLSMLVAIMAAPPVAIWGISPGTPLLFATYLFGLVLIRRVRKVPMWHPRVTPETREDTPEPEGDEPLSVGALWLRFGGYALLMATSGLGVAVAGVSIVEQTGLDQTAVGAGITATCTSMPEFVIAVAAVRQKALTLAVGNIIGGNSFDVLFSAFSDIAYRPGSIYHAVGPETLFIVALTQVMTGVLLLGLIRREKHGPANIGFESVFILAAYVTGVIVVAG